MKQIAAVSSITKEPLINKLFYLLHNCPQTLEEAVKQEEKCLAKNLSLMYDGYVPVCLWHMC